MLVAAFGFRIRAGWLGRRLTGHTVADGGGASERVSVNQVPEEVVHETQAMHLRLEAESLTQSWDYESKRGRGAGTIIKHINRGERKLVSALW